jgi:hypothetical protein
LGGSCERGRIRQNPLHQRASGFLFGAISVRLEEIKGGSGPENRRRIRPSRSIPAPPHAEPSRPTRAGRTVTSGQPLRIEYPMILIVIGKSGVMAAGFHFGHGHRKCDAAHSDPEWRKSRTGASKRGRSLFSPPGGVIRAVRPVGFGRPVLPPSGRFGRVQCGGRRGARAGRDRAAGRSGDDRHPGWMGRAAAGMR